MSPPFLTKASACTVCPGREPPQQDRGDPEWGNRSAVTVWGPTSDPSCASLLELQAQVVQLLLGGGAGGDIHVAGHLALRPRGSCEDGLH